MLRRSSGASDYQQWSQERRKLECHHIESQRSARRSLHCCWKRSLKKVQPIYVMLWLVKPVEFRRNV